MDVGDSCVICLDVLDPEQALICPNGHPQCSACFEQCVQSQAASDTADVRARSGRVCCPMMHADAHCGAPFAERLVAATVSEKTFEQHRQAERRAVEAELVESIQNHQPPPGSLEAHRQFIIDQILTLRCPACAAAVEDFDGCLAIHCHRCRVALCGICLMACGLDAHRHVVQCPHNSRHGLHLPTPEIHLAQNKVRHLKLWQFFEQHEPAVRDELLASLAVELNALGLSPERLRTQPVTEEPTTAAVAAPRHLIVEERALKRVLRQTQIRGILIGVTIATGVCLGALMCKRYKSLVITKDMVTHAVQEEFKRQPGGGRDMTITVLLK